MFVGCWKKGEELPDMPDATREELFVCKGPYQHYSRENVSFWFWGEFYNKVDLGYGSFDDLDILYDLYVRSGINGFTRLDGAFTCILQTPDTLLIMRDRHGLGGQVYYTDKYFASSLALLRSTKGFDATPDHRSLGLFLSTGYIATPSSALSGVSKLGAGEALLLKDKMISVIPLCSVDNIGVDSAGKTLDEYADKYASLHVSAIKRRIKGSQNLGILLSGGYDSGSNLAALRSFYNGDIRSYSIGFKGDNWTELPLARCMSDSFQTIHSEYEIDGSEIKALPEIIEHLGDPFVEGGLMVNYAVMRLIGKNKPDVILGGDGSDQYFGTSGREVALHYLIARYGLKPLVGFLYDILDRPSFDKDTLLYRIRFHLDKVLHILDGDRFGFSSFQLKKLLQDKDCLPRPAVLYPDTRSFEQLYLQHADKSDLKKVINQVILFKASKIADMFDNHLVFPYMDLSLYYFLLRLPVCYKCKGENVFQIAKGRLTSKFLLKYHYGPLLPEVITAKKKQGGFAPMPLFFREDEQRARIADYILSSSVVSDFLDRKYVEHFIAQYEKEVHTPGNWFWYKQNRAIQYFNLLALSVWWERFVEGKKESFL